MGAGIDVLASVNITRFARAIEDQRDAPKPLKFLERTSTTQASDNEIIARVTNQVYAADIVSPDSTALTRDFAGINFETSAITKVKHGYGITETQAQTLVRIERAQSNANDLFTFKGYIARNTANLLLGIDQRKETMIIGMLLDGYTYDRLGIKVGGSWNMPQAFKVEPVIDWDDDDATPITDCITLRLYAEEVYGQIFNRVTLSLALLTKVVATKQFRDMVKFQMYTWAAPEAALDVRLTDVNAMASVFGGMIGMTVETYDGMYREYQNDGSIAPTVRFFPVNVALFTNSADDNAATGYDWAQGIIMESVIGSLGGTGVIGGDLVEGYGPVAYATQADPALNPPGIAVWAVDRGAPRKLNPLCSAKITAHSV